jgi:hypothetical protein
VKAKFWFAVAAIAVSLSACSGAKGPPPVVKSPDSVVLTPGDITDRPYRVVKDLDVWVRKPNVFARDPTPADIDQELKKQAAKLDADAVIFVRYGTVGMGLFNWGQLEGRGRAVAFTK